MLVGAGRVHKKRVRGALTMSEQSTSVTGPVSFGQRLAASQVFTALFREGMGLVEETAAYLDGAGRQESRKLERPGALAYATESMRLTTRLMQLASWLLLHRAVNEGEMSLAQANKEKVKVKFASADTGGDPHVLALLPLRLQELIARSRELQLKVLRLDATIHAPAVALRAEANNPVERQLGLLKAAFEQDGA
jgi:regulator of CtrA degradation